LKRDLIPDYSVNLMWVNRSFQPSQNWLFPAANEQILNEKYLNSILAWARSIQGGIVQVWYDSALTSGEALQNTKKSLEDRACGDDQLSGIVLKDVREVPLVREHPRVFSSQMNVYFRVDLLRAIAAFHEVSSNPRSYFVYGDFDMEPLTREELFDPETVQNLKSVGIVVAKWGDEGVENGFQIVSGAKPHLLEAMKLAVIDLNLERAERFLKGKLYVPRLRKAFSPREAWMASDGQDQWKNAGAAIAQMVYESYSNLYRYFYHLENLGSLKVLSVSKNQGDPTQEEDYEKEKHGLIPFGVETSRIIEDTFKFDAVDPSLKLDRYGFPPVPAKKVKLPNTLGVYF
jgi:hypothetical protein